MNQVLYIEGKVQKNRYNDQLQIFPTAVVPAREVEEGISEQTCYIKIVKDRNPSEHFVSFRQLVKKYSGNVPVILFYEERNKQVLLESEYWVQATSELKQELQLLFGEENVVFK